MERLADIIKILSSSLGFVSIDDLAHDLDVTPRTIRNDLILLENALEGSNVRLVKKRNQGIALDKENISEKTVLNLLSQINGEKDFYSASERENLILEALLLEKGPLTLNKLKDLTLSSKSSITKNLSVCEKNLANGKSF